MFFVSLFCLELSVSKRAFGSFLRLRVGVLRFTWVYCLEGFSNTYNAAGPLFEWAVCVLKFCVFGPTSGRF